MTESLLQGKTFYCREWALRKLQRCLDACPSGRNRGVLITGGPGSGKTALCTEVLWPVSEHGRRFELSARVLAHHFCQAQDVRTLSVSGFVLSVVRQAERCSMLQGYQDRLRDSSVQALLQPSECQRNPDETFKRSVLLPLLELEPPAHNLLLLVDSIDEAEAEGRGEGGPRGQSCSIGELLSHHHRLLPPWVLLVCSARSNKTASHMFTGFRRVCLDDVRKAPVVRDVQRYIAGRLEREPGLRRPLNPEPGLRRPLSPEPGLRRPLSPDTAELVHQLLIKSSGCFLYLERVLEGGALGEIRRVPGTLSGLYLWLFQRLFPGGLFPRVRPLLNVLLAARRPLRPRRIFEAVRSRCGDLTPAEWERRLRAVWPLLRAGPRHTRLLLHHSLGEWLLDVKLCTERYLCDRAQGHAMLAMGLSLRARRLRPPQVRDLALHLVRSGLRSEPWRLALWMVWCGAPVGRGALACAPPGEPEVQQVLLKAGAEEDGSELGGADVDVDGSESEDEDVGAHEGTEGGECRGEDAVRLLPDSGAGVERRDTGGSANGGERGEDDRGADTVRLLPDSGAGVEQRDTGGNANGGERGDEDAVRRLLESGAGVERRDTGGSANGGERGDEDAVRRLLESGAGVEQRDAGGRTLLARAAHNGSPELVQRLLARGAELEARDGAGQTPLSLAARRGHAAVLRSLLAHGADVNQRDGRGWTPLHAASFRGHAAACQALLEHGARVDAPDGEGRVPAILAAQEGHAPCVCALLERGSPPEARDSDGRSGLWAAALAGHGPVVRLLLARGASAGGRDAAGRPLLYLLALDNRLEMVRLLVEAARPDLEARDPDGRTALHVASWLGHQELVRLLLGAGARVDALDGERRSALHSAAWRGHTAVAGLLLESGAAVDHVCSQGATGLCIAAQEGHAAVVRLLLESGADPSHADCYGRTPMRVAARGPHTGVMRLLQCYGAPASNGCPGPEAPPPGSPDTPDSSGSRAPSTARTVPVDSRSSTQPGPSPQPPPAEKRNGTPGPGGGSPGRPAGGGGGPARRARVEPLIAITSLDPELKLKQAVKLRFEGPTSGLAGRKETPL